MPDAATDPVDPIGVSAYFGAVSRRADERSLSTWLALRPDLCDASGALRVGAVTYAVDVATGISCGLAVLDRELWVVTTDLDVHLAEPITAGPLRVDVEVLRAGATTAVAAFTLHDEGRGRQVGGGTATSRPFPFEFDRSFLQFPIGVDLSFVEAAPVEGEPMAAQLGFVVAEDGSATVQLADRLRNPWGILHGGVTACLADHAGMAAASAALGAPARPTGQLVRYLAPGRVGPVHARPVVLAAADGRAVVEVRVTDEGADGRLLAVSTLTASPVSTGPGVRN